VPELSADGPALRCEVRDMSIGTPHLARIAAMNVIQTATGAPTDRAGGMRDGDHWVELHRYATRTDASTVIGHLVERGVATEDLRIRRLRG
jgi:hypothetical protein